MILPRNLISGSYDKPNCFLCETDKAFICKLETTNMKGSFKFNSYSTLNFDVARFYNNMLTGETCVNPFYDKVEAIRLIKLDGFGYFELQDPEIDCDGIKEIKSLTAHSLEYTLSQKYLELFNINTGKVDSVEVLYAAEHNDGAIIPVVLYNPDNPKLSLLHLILEKAYGWSIGHVDQSLWKLSRQFEVSRQSIYDFIMNEICTQFNCYAVFDTENNTVNLYAESLVNKFTGDGATKTFMISPVFSEIGTVSIDGYKTTDYTYNTLTGELILGAAPESGRIVEVTDGALSSWETDVYVTFANLAQQMNISYSSDDIKTVLTVKGSDDLDIREVNNGLPYIVDLSYFYTPDWMGQDLYDAYTIYLEKCNSSQLEYKINSQKIIELSNRIAYENNRLSLQYSEASVSSETVGTYYVRGGDAESGYFYTEVSLPSAYVVGTTYYSTLTTDLNETKVENLYGALKTYYHTGELTGFTGEESTLTDDFSFMENNKIADLVSTLGSEDSAEGVKDAAVTSFFDEMWEQIGLTPLKKLYFEPYKGVQTANVSAGWSENNNDNYGLYYPVVLLLNSLTKAITKRENTIKNLTDELEATQKSNAEIGTSLLIENNFNENQMIKLSAFLREDEYTDNNFVVTGNESTEELLKLKQELLECGRIELSKLCQPCLKFSMSLANIYALPEFAPIVGQFQLGNLIKIALRSNYMKHTRLMQVDLNFEDFSDFSCQFGDLASIRSQSDLHADLLSQAVSAGKTVASNASYWDKGTDKANSIDVRLQQGLLNAATEIKSIDGTQHSYLDKYGLHLQEVDPVTGEVSPEQGWIVNNKFLYSDDAFATTKSVFGKYTVNDETKWGLIAEAVLAGYIEGSTIKGGTIQIGERPDGKYNFAVDNEGVITFYGGKGISSTGEEVDLDTYNTTVELTSNASMLTSSNQSITLTCQVYSYMTNVTEDYDATAFTWMRSTGDDDADEEWNVAHQSIANGNTLNISASDIVGTTFFQCVVKLSTGDSKSSNSISITTGQSDIHVFTVKPDQIKSDGYCYHVGDLWVVGQDYQPATYQKNTILVSQSNSASYSDDDWAESVYYSKTFGDIQDWQDNMQEHVQILGDGLHLIGPTDEGVSFESVLQSKKLTFRSNNGGNPTDVVWLGTDDTTAKNMTALNYLKIQPEENSDILPHMQIGNFTFQIEDNGSLSII